MNVWAHDGLLYEVDSGYSLPDDAWRYELAGISGAPGSGPYLVVIIPDATPEDGPFSPKQVEHVRTVIHDGRTPWPVLLRFVDLIEGSGDVTHGHEATSDIGTLASSNNEWQFADRRFEVNSFHIGDRGSWCYELYEVAPGTSENNYIEVQIPDASRRRVRSLPRRPIRRRSRPTGHGRCHGRSSDTSSTSSRHRATSSRTQRQPAPTP
ncbi:hypothetical protein [Embleya sp. NPDC059237]|uniref:hypothetical protein n=1 Tax=Embleya sp. NPDC059237 TaxID=3346784 RepID=UPI0036A7519A